MKKIEKIILIIGLPGSGKSTLGNSLCAENDNLLFLDDISILTKNAKSYLIELKNNFLNKKINNKIDTLLISDVNFCITEVREKAINIIKGIFFDITLEKIFFENDKQKCLENVERRKLLGDTREVELSISYLSNKYIIEDSANIKEIYTSNKDLKSKLS